MIETLTRDQLPLQPEISTDGIDTANSADKLLRQRSRYQFGINERFMPSQQAQEVQITPLLGEDSKLEGFDLGKEMRRLFNHYNQNLREGKIASESWNLSVGELEMNLRTFVVEYVQTKTILPHVNRIEEINGKNSMVGYNGVAVVDGITVQERLGGVKEASIKVDEFMSTKTPNRMAVINSPVGKSGFVKKNGAEITYKDNQTMVFWTDQEGVLHGLTIVSDLNEVQSRQLSIELGVDQKLLIGQTELERVSNIVRNPSLFSYSKALKNPAEYVLDKIIAIRGKSDFRLLQEDGSVEIRSVAKTREDIQKVSELLNFNSVIESYIANLKRSLLLSLDDLNNPAIQAQIAKAVEKTLLNIVINHLGLPSVIPAQDRIFFVGSKESFDYANSVYEEENYRLAAAFLKTRSGCAGGGGGGTSSLRGISLGSNVSTISGSENFTGSCGECGRSSNDNHYHCPDCKTQYADETSKSPESRTKQCSCGFKFGC